MSFVLAGGADTIVARATPAGRGALAVVRVSGPESRSLASSIAPRLDFDRPWCAQLVRVQDEQGLGLERAVVIPYRAPRSYTGEDMVEIMVHGSLALVRRLEDAAVALGCRPARPGEFTRRAVANGKMDLVQAEGVANLVAAETRWQLKVARAQLSGALSERLAAVRSALLGLLARVEGSLDWGEQGVNPAVEELLVRRQAVLGMIDALIATARAGERVRDGVRVVITGPPNAGKSTLFNRLLERERAIVSPHPGTTRDCLEAEIEIAGMRVTLIDTAGVADPRDALEAEGVRRAQAATAEANAAIVVRAADAQRGDEPEVPADVPCLRVLTKIDLVPEGRRAFESGWSPVSLVTGEGWPGVAERLDTLVGEGLDVLEGGCVINLRQRLALEAARAEIAGAVLERPEIAAEALRAAAERLEEVTGRVTSEDVVEAVFARFCIGK